MDLNEIIRIAEQVPVLTEQVEKLQNEIVTLKQRPGYKEILTVSDVHEITGFKSATVVRRIMKEIGSTKCKGKVFVLRDDFTNYFRYRKQPSGMNIDNKVIDYEIKRAKKLAKV